MSGRSSAEITPGGAVLLALWLLVVPLRWLAGVAAAAAVHEICHLLALVAMGVQIHGIRFGGDGIFLDVGEMTEVQDGICAAAGPVGSFALLGLCHVFPEAAVSGMAQGVFNLIPVYPFDGGRILESVLGNCPPLKKKQILGICASVSVGVLWAAAIVGAAVFQRYRIFLIAGGALIAGKVLKKNTLQRESIGGTINITMCRED